MEKARLKKAFWYIPGDIIRKEDLNLDEGDWADHLKEPFIVDEITIENNLDLVYSLLDDTGTYIIICEADLKEETE